MHPSKRSARAALGAWEPVTRPEGPADWFGEAGGLPPFDPASFRTDGAFSAAQSWWLAELCRLAYTPDRKEATRPWHRDKPPRHPFLEHRTPFREVANLHRTGNHAALYRIEGGQGAVLCFRGTNKLRQWLLNLTALPVPWSGGGSGVFVHHGFQILYDRVWPDILPCLLGIDGPLILTGHSLGAAFATLAAAQLREAPAALVTFGSPRVGNLAFAERLAERGGAHWRVANHADIVTLLPQREPRLGPRDYRHAARPFILGREPGSIFFGGMPDEAQDPDWRPDEPLAYLARSFRGPAPPECVLSHLPVAYSAKLRSLAAGEIRGCPD